MVNIVEQVLIFLIFSVAGYILTKTKFINGEHIGLLSKIIVFLFLPATTLKSLSEYFSVASIKKEYISIISSLVILVVIAAVSFIVMKFTKLKRFTKNIYMYSLMVPNYGYMGYALANSMFGPEMEYYVIIFCLPLCIYTYTLAYCLLTMDEEEGFKFDFKRFINPVFIATVIGCILGLCSIELPAFFVDLFTKASNCTGPISMILVGSVIAEFKLKDLLLDWRAYIIVALRILVIPIAACLILKALNLPTESLIIPAVLTLAMPCGSNTIVFSKMKGESSEAAASPVIISTVLCLISIPLCLKLAGVAM